MVGIIELIVLVVIVGVILFLVETYIPMDAGVKRFLQIAVIIVLVLWLISALGLLGSVGNIGIR